MSRQSPFKVEERPSSAPEHIHFREASCSGTLTEARSKPLTVWLKTGIETKEAVEVVLSGVTIGRQGWQNATGPRPKGAPAQEAPSSEIFFLTLYLNSKNASGQCSKSQEFDLTKNIPVLPDAAPDTSVYPDPEQPQQGTSKNQSEPYFSVNNIASSPYVTDKGNLKELTDQVKRFVIENGHCKPKGPFLKDSDNRSFLEKHYYIVSKSGVKLERTWLSYSLILQKAYCEPCWLFANRASKKIQNVRMEGYDDWKHIVDAIERHETSKIHLDSCLTYRQWRLHGTLDEEQESVIKKGKSFWRQVLSRLLEVPLTLSACNLAFRGHSEKADSNYSSSLGNFLSIIELLGKYDPISQELLSKPKGQIKYLSPKIQNGLISVLVLKIENSLINEINAAPFYSIIFDTTQDISKIYQMCELYRYCMIEKDGNEIPKALVIKESFLGFHEVKDQTALAMSKQIIKSINDRNIPLNKCRANTMKGTYGGIQKLIKDIEPNAVYVHCAAHNLNLVLNDAVREVLKYVKYNVTVFNDRAPPKEFAAGPRWYSYATGSTTRVFRRKQALRGLCACSTKSPVCRPACDPNVVGGVAIQNKQNPSSRTSEHAIYDTD
ncbi:Zinc finger MYM-type protein 1 [Eumeta japonica]|uniref:Zinc finger MYM-type protein 1 n=1 Tax=Eumeta variegata TaxID=151549 RepID=A0A4C1SRQ1_EUMVA|nr:Zinc finger MYM-type protein 1 [Eumeta japonica]